MTHDVMVVISVIGVIILALCFAFSAGISRKTLMLGRVLGAVLILGPFLFELQR